MQVKSIRMTTHAESLEAQNRWFSAINSQVAHAEENNPSREAAAQMMDVEMAAMSSALCFFRNRRNAVLPVSILPHDVLFLVFSLLACEEPPAGANVDSTSSVETDLEDMESEDTASEDAASENAASEGPASEDTASEDTTAEDTVFQDTALEGSASEDMAFEDTDAEGNESADSSYVPTNHGERDSAAIKPAIILGWIKVTHVCRQWRQVALQHARLWSDNIVSTLGSQWLEEMVARSGSAPISLIYDQLSTQHCGRLSNYMPRIHHLWLTQPAQDLLHLSPYFDFPATMLDTLRVSTCRIRDDDDLDYFPLAHHLFANAPHLRRLIVDGYMAPQASFCVNLTHLEVYGHNQFFEDLSLLLDSLRHMTVLRCLILEFCLPPWTMTDMDCLPMPHLEDLTLAGLPRGCASLMQSLIIPASVRLNLKFPLNEKDMMVADFRSVLPCVTSLARTSSCLIPLRTLWASRLDGAHGYLVRVWRDYCPPGQSDSFEHIRDTGSPQITITFPVKDMDNATHMEDTIIPDFIGALATPQLRALCVETVYWPAPLRTWMDILTASPDLQYIRVCSSSAITVCEALATTPDDDRAAFILPELQFLELQNVHFGLAGLGSSESFDELLPHWIAWRQSRAPLSRLAITGCHVEEECIGSLREVVDVDWDGRRGEYDSDWYECSEESGSETDASWSDEDPELAQLVLDVIGGNSIPDN